MRATHMRVFHCIAAFGLAAISLLNVNAELANGIRAVVHDSVITVDEVDSEIGPAAVRLSEQFHNQPDVFQNKLNELRSAKLEELLDRQLILHQFKTAGYNLPESIVDELVQEEMRLQFPSRAVATKTLEQQGLTQERFRQRVRDRFVIGALRQKNVSSEIIISPHKVESYYLAHKDDFKVEDEVKLRMIELKKSVESNQPDARKLAEEILTKLKEGASFEEMAKIHSTRSQRSTGPETFQTSRLRKELAEVVSKLKTGERSDVIDTPEACYLVLVEETHPTHVKTLAEVREEIEKDLLSQERARLEKQWVERLKKKTFFRYF